MLDGFLGRGFSGKCKSSIKDIKARIDVIRRKRNAMLKYLKKDMADLLSSGLDINAYGRAEGLLVELYLSSCYDFVEQFCECILKQLSVMQKQSACPEECREAVPSLMFAAARFADLPELRDLRQIFTEKYGSSLEAFVNQEFVEKLAPKPLTMDKKLQLMRKIAQEFSIKWDSTAFEQKMPNAPSSAQDQLKKHRSFNDGNDNGHNMRDGREDTVPKRDNQNVFSRGRQEITKDGYKSHNDREDTVPKRDNPDHLLHERKELTGDEYKLHKGRGDAIQKKEDRDLSSHGRQESNINGYKSFNGREDNIPKRNNQDGLSHGRWEVIKDAYEPRKGMDHTVAKREKQDLLSDGRREFTDDGYKRHNTIGDTVMKRDKQELLSDGRREFTDDSYKWHNARGDRQEFTDDGYKRHNARGDRREFTDDGYKRHNTRGDIADDGYKRHNTRGDTLMKREQDILSCPRQELIDDEYKHYNHREVPRRPEVAPTHTAREQVKAVGKDKPIPGSSHNDLQNHSNSIENVPKEEAKSMKPFSNNIVPPPYIKPKDGKYGTKPEAHLTGSDFDGSSLGPAFHNRDFGNNQRPQMAKNKSDHVDYERQMAGPESDSADDGKPKPRSVRRRHLKSPPGCENDGNFEFDEGVKRSSSGRRRDHARRRHHALFDDDQDQKDEEEKMMDRLLIHYSKKQPAYEQCVHNRLRRESKDPTAHQARADVSEKQPPYEQYVQDRPRKEFKPPAHQVHADVSERRRHRNRDGDHLSSEARHPLARTLSLPSEPQTPTEVSRRPVRAASFQPDRASSAAHVHPKLPDYDDLADRIAALRGR